MPWCEECAKYFTPNSVASDGSCPACGDTIQQVEGAEAAGVADDEKAPWHFKLLVLATVGYLAWRVVDLFL